MMITHAPDLSAELHCHVCRVPCFFANCAKKHGTRDGQEHSVRHRVTITFASDRPYEFYATRVFWFAEALYSSIVDRGLGTLNDIDRARDVIWVELSDKRRLGEVKKIVRKALERFSLTADAVVSVS